MAGSHNINRFVIILEARHYYLATTDYTPDDTTDDADYAPQMTQITQTDINQIILNVEYLKIWI